MNNLKKSVTRYALNEEKLLNKVTRPSMFGLKLAGAFALAFVLMFALLPHLRPNTTLAYTATVRVEINPAFDILVNENDLVVDILALNEDAQGFDKTPFINEPVADAIAAIIAYALEKGFITEDELESDVVTVTVINDEDEEDEEIKEAIDNLGARIQERLRNQEEAQKVDVVFIKATLRELFEAAGKEIPLGLYVIKGQRLLEDGTLMPMREFLASEQGREVKATIRAEKFELRAMRKALERLEEEGEDVDDLDDELDSIERPLKDRLDAIKNRIKEIRNTPRP